MSIATEVMHYDATEVMHYEIRLDDYSFFGPDGAARVLVEGIEVVHGPDRSNWHPADYLVRVLQPFPVDGTEVTHLLLSPRYDTDTVDDIMTGSCTVGVGVVNPGCTISAAQRYTTSDVTYWNIGTVSPLTE